MDHNNDIVIKNDDDEYDYQVVASHPKEEPSSSSSWFELVRIVLRPSSPPPKTAYHTGCDTVDTTMTTKGDQGTLGNDRNKLTQQWIQQAAFMMEDHWPKGGSLNEYRTKITSTASPSSSSVSTTTTTTTTTTMDDKSSSLRQHSLPCSYLLIDTSTQTCIG